MKSDIIIKPIKKSKGGFRMKSTEIIRKAATGCGFVILGFFGIRAFIGIVESIKYMIFGVF